MTFLFDDCELDVDTRELRVRGEPLPVEPQVFDVLALLVRERDRMVSKDELLDAVWHHRFVTESAVSSRIKSARRAIGDDGRTQRLIRTVHGRGYQFVGAVRAAERAGRPAGRRSTPVPAPATTTVGRGRAIEDVVDLLDRARIVTLLGPGGVGKTRLGAEAALRLGRAGDREGCFVDLTKVRDPGLVPALIVRELGIHPGEDGDARQTLEEALRGQSVLLMLDNFEHVVDAAGVVGDVVRACPGVQVLVTSRARLRIAGEHVYDVAPLAVDGGGDGDDGGDALGSAVALFDQAATAVDPSFRLADHQDDVVAICRTVDGLPLAIELAAGHVRTLPPALLRTRLGDRLGSPDGAARDAPARQRTIAATIDWSLALLGPHEQALFARLGVFAGAVPLDAVEEVCAAPGGDTVAGLGRLVDQSLVRRVPGPSGEPRFVLLELMRERARELLAARDDARAVAGRHAAWFAAYVEGLEDRRWLDLAGGWIDRVNEMLGEIRAARAWAQAEGEVEPAARITGSLGNWWHREGHMVEGRQWVTEALATGDRLPPLLAARVRLAAGFVTWPLDGVAARGHWEAAAAGFERLGEDRYLACALNMVSATYIGDRAHYDHARGLSDRALAVARGVGEGPLIASALTVRGELTRVHGDDATARAAYEESRVLVLDHGDDQHLAMLLGNLAFIAEHDGDFATAYRLTHESIARLWSIGRRFTSADGVAHMAGAVLGLGWPERAAVLIGAANEALRVMGSALSVGDRSEQDRVLAVLGDALGEPRLARLLAEGAGLSLDEAVEMALAPVERWPAGWPATGDVSPR